MAENKEEKSVNTEKEEKKQEIKKEVKKEPVKKTEKKEVDKKVEGKPVEEVKKGNTFKKVETNNSKEKSKHTVLKTILVLIAIFVIAYLVFVIRNYVILKDVCEKASKYENVTNYTYHSKGKTVEYTAMVKDGVTRVDMNNLEDESKNLIVWADSNSKESIVSFVNQKTAVKDSFSGVVVTVPFEISMGDNLIMSSMLYAWIHTEEFDGKECYVIKISSDYELWVDKETGLVVKRNLGNNDFMEITNIGIENVDEIYKPDLTGYKITEYDKDNTETE